MSIYNFVIFGFWGVIVIIAWQHVFKGGADAFDQMGDLAIPSVLAAALMVESETMPLSLGIMLLFSFSTFFLITVFASISWAFVEAYYKKSFPFFSLGIVLMITAAIGMISGLSLPPLDIPLYILGVSCAVASNFSTIKRRV